MYREFVAELLASGAPVRPDNAARVLPIVISHGFAAAERRKAELAAGRSEARRWMAHNDVVQLAFDFVELRAIEERLRATEQRVAELEQRVGSGIGSEGEETAAAAAGASGGDGGTAAESGGAAVEKSSGGSSGGGE
jgi:hypothetical protein